MHIHNREIQRNFRNISQGNTQRLAGNFFARIGEKVQNYLRWQAKQSGYPREQVIKHRPNQERPKDTTDPFFIKDGSIVLQWQQQSSRNHHKQRNTRTEKRSIGCPPELNLIDISWWFTWIKVKRICTMATNHGKHGNKTYHIQPNNMRSANCRILTLHHNISILLSLYSKLRTARRANGTRKAFIALSNY